MTAFIRRTRPKIGIDFVHQQISFKKYENILALIVIVVLFVYFGRIATETHWPPIGDPILHSSLTSIIIEKHSIIKDRPFPPFPMVYPLGYHAFSANLSLMLGVYPAEAVLITGSYLMVVISCLFFTLAITLTRQYWLALPIPFSLLIAHSSNHLESWIAGYIFIGTYPALFGLLVTISIIVLMQLSSNQRSSLYRVMPMVLLLLSSLLFTYPNFIPHSLIFMFAYYISQKIEYRLKKDKSHVADKKRLSFDSIAEAGARKASSSSESTSGNTIEKTTILQRIPYKLTLLNTCIALFFVGVIVFGGLVPFYQQLIANNFSAFSNIAQFERTHPNAKISLSNAWNDVNADTLFKLLIALQVAVFALLLVLESKVVPLALGSLILMLILILPFTGFIYPLRTLTFAATLSWPILVYAISQFTGSPRVERKKSIKYGTIIAFVGLVFAAELPYIYDQAARGISYGWHIQQNQIEDTFDTFLWIKANTSRSDLILNDMTLSGTYVDGITPKNITHSYASGFLRNPPSESHPRLVMAQDLKKVWLQPYNQELVKGLLDRYGVEFIFLTPMPVYQDYKNWGGNGVYKSKPFTNDQYEEFFNSYPFLDLVFHSGKSSIYAVS